MTKGRITSEPFPLESNIPIPPRQRGRPDGDERFKWTKMQVGDSFFVANDADGEAVETRIMRKRMEYRAYKARKRHGGKFVVLPDTQKNEETGEEKQGVRVWREK